MKINDDIIRSKLVLLLGTVLGIGMFGNTLSGKSFIVGSWHGGLTMDTTMTLNEDGSFSAIISGRPTITSMSIRREDQGEYSFNGSTLTLNGKLLKQQGQYDTRTQSLYLTSNWDDNTMPVVIRLTQTNAQQIPTKAYNDESSNSSYTPVPVKTFAKKWVFRRAYRYQDPSRVLIDAWRLDYSIDLRPDGSYREARRESSGALQANTGKWSLVSIDPPSDAVMRNLFSFTDRTARYSTQVNLALVLESDTDKKGESTKLRVAEYLDQPFSVTVFGMRLQAQDDPNLILEFYPADTPENLLRPTRPPQ